MRLILLVALIAGLIHAQNQPIGPDPARPILAIQGAVVDKDSHDPIPGAYLTVMASGPNGPDVDYRGTFADAKTGSSGDFRMEVNTADSFTVAAQVRGYEHGQARVANLAPGQSTVYVEIALTRHESVSGALIDDDTREPIAGVDIELIAHRADLPGLDLMMAVAKTVSLADGTFAIADVPRGEYVLRITAKPSPAITEIPAKDLEGDNREKALATPEGTASYGTIVWPGQNADLPATPGVRVGAAPVDLGEIRLTKNKLRNVTGLIAPCEDGATIEIKLARKTADPFPDVLATREITCGSGFRILNVPDGTFTLTAMQGFPQRRWVSQTIDAHVPSLLRLNLAAFVKVQISMEIDGVTAAEVPSSVRLNLDPENRSVKVDAPVMLRPGSFEATLYPGERYLLSPQLPKKYFVKRITYDGAGLADLSAFTASVAPLSQLSIVLSDQAGSIKVTVTSSGNPPKTQPAVVLWRDGTSFAEFSRRFTTSFRPAAASGTAVFDGLIPGRYHVAVVSTGQPLPTTEALFGALSVDTSRASATVTVDEGQTASVTIDVP